jgi:hypothetical protein
LVKKTIIAQVNRSDLIKLADLGHQEEFEETTDKIKQILFGSNFI